MFCRLSAWPEHGESGVRKEGKGMKLTIEAEPKEIAALVVAIQERREDDQVQLILNRLQEKLHQNESILWL